MSTNIYVEYEDGSVNHFASMGGYLELPGTLDPGDTFNIEGTVDSGLESYENMSTALSATDEYAEGGQVRSAEEPEPVLRRPAPYSFPEVHMVGTEFDPVQRPSHYTEGRDIEPINVIEDWELDFHLGNALKYISRSGRKSDGVEDMKKAVWYLERRIEAQEQDNG